MTPESFVSEIFGLNGKTAVVIGGTGVLGGTIGETLGNAGAHVILCGRDPSKAAGLVERLPSAESFPLDATNRDNVRALIEKLAAEDRPCDVLVNAAGVNSATPFLEIPDDEWEQILSVNLNSVRLTCQEFGKAMVAAGRPASIINVASMSAEIPLSRVFTYSVSKAGVLNLTRNLAREWASAGIRVNALSPGFFPAEQNRKVLTPDRVADIMKHTPMDRFGEPHELAGAVLLLASPVAGAFITGLNLAVDGGFSAMTI